MKEHPIIFSTDMVKSILDGRKTQTRRVIKPQPEKGRGGSFDWKRGRTFTLDSYCPYGQVGDRLWVRETFWIEHDSEFNEYSAAIIDCGINLAEDDWTRVWYCATDEEPDNDGIPPSVYSKRPSIHMPRWASRITLEITGVRVERLQKISLNDIRAEGIPDNRATYNAPIQLEKFVTLWDSINAKRGYGWETNPWVWVIEFKREK